MRGKEGGDISNRSSSTELHAFHARDNFGGAQVEIHMQIRHIVEIQAQVENLKQYMS